MRRALLVTNQDWGHFAHRLPLARALRDAGLEPVFVSSPGPYVTHLESAGFRFIPWRLDRRSLNPLRELMPLAELARIYRQERPDAVFHFTIKPLLYGSLAARIVGVPAVVNVFTGVGFPFLETGPSRYYRPFLAPLLRLLLRGKRRFAIFHNEEDRGSLVERGIISDARSVTIFSSGVDTKRFTPKRPHAGREVPVVLMAARLLWDKGIVEYVEAAKRLRAHGVRARFLVAGEPDPGSTLAVDQELLTRWREEGAVEFLGHRNDIDELLREADVAVLPSYHEGLPRFLLEAAAAGLPIVATDISGCRAVVRPGVNGSLVPPRDATALADALTSVLSDPKLRRRMGEASRKIAIQEFSEEQAMAAHIGVLQGLGVRLDGGA